MNLPPRNPYQISIRTEGYIGGKIFKYVIDFLNSDGRAIVKPEINGAILHVGKENLFRLNANQFALVNLAKRGNENLSREEPLITVKKIQETAPTAEAKLDGYLSKDNKNIIVVDKLDVDFQESGDSVKVQPILLKNCGGELKAIDSEDFQGAFNNRKGIKSTYRGRNRTQYVFSKTLQDGLKQIKSVGALSKEDAFRYKLQPKELFSGEAFDFDYSDRVIGVEKILIGTYQNVVGDSKIEWGKGGVQSETPAPEGTKPRSENYVLKIKENFEQIDYNKGLNETRQGKFFADVLCPGIKLYDYQIQGVWRMSQLWQDGWRGVLLADDMGLGKTLQTLIFIGGLKKFCADYPQVNFPMLIVAPTALLMNWEVEYKKFLRGNIFSDVIPLHGNALKKFMTGELTPNGKKKLSLKDLPTNSLALTTYETLRDYQFSFAQISWSIIIADEAQKIKNPEAGITKALKAMKYDFAICLSGTPVENSWVDLWSIMDFVQPAHLNDLKTFKAKYIDSLTGENIQRLGEEFRKSLEPLILRRMKEDYLPALPKKNIILCSQEMPPYQSKIYSAVLEKYRGGGFKSPLEFIIKIREVSLHPDLEIMSTEKFFTLNPSEIINRSARLIKTFEVLNEIKTRGEKVLIFVTSRKMQLILRHLLEKIFEIKILPPINGDMNGLARQKFIDEFKKSDGFNVLILSPEAAGVGFTITEANNVIHLSRTWNPAKENQATDRVYRIGQEKAVNIYLPLAVSKNLRGKTFDENLETLLGYKRKLSAKILFPSAETATDIQTLITIMNLYGSESAYWMIEDVDNADGYVFEKIISDLYNAMENFSAIKTPDSNDFGADVVVQSLSDNTGILIQCKHTGNPDKSIGNSGVQEICAAIAYYEKKFHGRKFQPAVVTNAKNFTSGAIELAQKNGVKLISRRELEKLFRDHKICKC